MSPGHRESPPASRIAGKRIPDSVRLDRRILGSAARRPAARRVTRFSATERGRDRGAVSSCGVPGSRGRKRSGIQKAAGRPEAADRLRRCGSPGKRAAFAFALSRTEEACQAVVWHAVAKRRDVGLSACRTASERPRPHDGMPHSLPTSAARSHVMAAKTAYSLVGAVERAADSADGASSGAIAGRPLPDASTLCAAASA
jgi:hypothetical protein